MRLSLLAAAAATMAACSLLAPKLERPAVSVASIELVSGNLLKQNFLVKLDVENPNDRALPVTSLHADLNLLGERVATGASSQPFVVPPHGTTRFDLTITANLALVLLKLGQRPDPHSDSVAYEMTGNANIDLPFLHDLQFHQAGVFSLSNLLK